ncbi:MAG: hypothetical protein NTU91_11410, partial [Chloroflexi bacterium]|nr:hypothetical protein [Chloroflexota bacterium]
MRNRLPHLVAIALLMAGCRPATATPASTPAPPMDAGAPTLFDTPWSDRSIFAAGLDDSQQSVLAGLPGASVYHLDLTIASDLQTVDGAEEILYTNT